MRSNLDDVVDDDAEPHPAVHSDEGLVAATIVTASPLDDADASWTPGPPFLAVAESALRLFALGALVHRTAASSG